jgi:hypothetical protein
VGRGPQLAFFSLIFLTSTSANAANFIQIENAKPGAADWKFACLLAEAGELRIHGNRPRPLMEPRYSKLTVGTQVYTVT